MNEAQEAINSDFILDENEEKHPVARGTHLVFPGRIDPDTFPGFWSRGDLPDWLDGPLYGTVQKIQTDGRGRVTYMDVGLWREYDAEDEAGEYPPMSQGDETKFGVELRIEDENEEDTLAEFTQYIHWQ